MKNKKNFISNFLDKNITVSIIVTYGLIVLIAVLLIYYFLPTLLNYGPGTINTSFDKEFSSGLTYSSQYFIIYIMVFFLLSIWLSIELRDFNSYMSIYEESKSSELAKQKLDKIRKKCLRIPPISFILATFIPTIFLSIVFICLGFVSFADIKVIALVFMFSALGATLIYISSKSILDRVLINTNNSSNYNTTKLKIAPAMILQLLPMILVCVLYTFLFSYSNFMEDKSNTLASHYTYEVNSIVEKYNPQSIDELISVLKEMSLISESDEAFIITSDKEFINLGEKDLSAFFKKYALDLSDKYENRVYDYYGTETQGVLIPISLGNEEIRVGIKYSLSSPSGYVLYWNVLLILFICVIIIYYYSYSLSRNISSVANKISDIVTNKNSDLDDKLPITSNDEIGDLVIAFNKIQDLTKQNISEIKNNEQSLMEKERLASLGQLIGGIAHNMKTPIMSIAGAAEGLTELVSEYVASISNSAVTPEDHKSIANDMLSWVTKIKTHTAYMSDIITTVKGQAVQFNTSEYDSFTIYDLSKRVDILIKHEIKNALLTLNIKIDCDPSLVLHGDINSLIQVINNLITNAIYSYNGVPGKIITFYIAEDEKNIYLSIIDDGCGMSKDVQEKLFKEMFTTKGKNGSGLGLYMSYATIKGKFGGTITCQSEEGKGSKFTVIIPIK